MPRASAPDIVVGEETRRLMEVFALDHGIRDREQQQIKIDEATRILSNGPNGTVGLALGFVQSGKTMSFTTLAALAADNGYRIVVMLLGNTHLLTGQNTERLTGDLRIASRGDFRWASLEMPKASTDLDFYLDQPGRVLLITTLKRSNRIEAIAKALERSNQAGEVECLIIDDEADQASLNTMVGKKKESATYLAIQHLRAVIPRHLYVQYTATAFAPLLLEPEDHLSPTFLEVLTPGPDYAGGATFFIDHRATVVRPLTKDEVGDGEDTSLPAGMRRAVDSFIVGSALSRSEPDLPRQVSMLIHTSGLKVDHEIVHGWVSSYLSSLRHRANGDPDDVGWITVRERLLVVASDYTDHGAAPVSPAELEVALRSVLTQAQLWVVNSSEEYEELNWARSPYNILIGGNKLDRGFTVKNLTVTYMTRSTTKGQADTIEQRARCYGYKRSYIDYCRVFAPPSVIDSFTSLVHTEADLRSSLLSWVESGRPLGEWSLSEGILLPDDMRPTRRNVLGELSQRSFADWSWQRGPSFDAEDNRVNRGLLDALGLFEAPTSDFGEVHLNTLNSVPSEVVLSTVLEPWRHVASPGWDHPLLKRAIRRLNQAGLLDDMAVALFQRRLKGGELAPRERAFYDSCNEFGEIPQGRNDGTGYPGDRFLVPRDRAFLQVHRLKKKGRTDEAWALGLYLPEVAGGLARAIYREVAG